MVDNVFSHGWWRELWYLPTAADKILVTVSLIASLLTFGVHWNEEGGAFQVRVAGQLQGPYPLDGFVKREFEGPLGMTLLVAEHGAVRVVSSPCPHHICMRSGSIKRIGQLLACVPNLVVVEVVGRLGEREFDAVAR